MIPAIVIGRGQSKGMPQKNMHLLGFHPMMSYTIRAAENCNLVDEVFFSTEDQQLKDIALHYGARVIDRPEELATDEALSEDVFCHAYKEINKPSLIFDGVKYYEETTAAETGEKIEFGIKGTFDEVRLEGIRPEFLVLLFANAPCITSAMITEMIETLRKWGSFHSICTVSKYNMFSPYRARLCKVTGVENFLPQEQIKGDCQRDSAEDVWYYDCSCAVIRPICLENIEDGLLPQKWLGRQVLAYKQETPALDVDYEWQLGQVKFWLEKNWKGFEK